MRQPFADCIADSRTEYSTEYSTEYDANSRSFRTSQYIAYSSVYISAFCDTYDGTDQSTNAARLR